MDTELKFRTAQTEDKEKLKKLGLNSFGQFESILTEENWNKLKLNLANESTYSNLLSISTCFVCEAKNEIVGMAFFIPNGNPTDVFPEDYCYLRMVGVHTQFGGKGIGRQLVQLCVAHAKASGEHYIALHTGEFMDSARHIYESMGFVRIKELDQRFGKKYWFYVLKL